MEIMKFCLNYPWMNNKHFDYTRKQMVEELLWIERGFICIGWGKTYKKGTKAKFKLGTLEELKERVKQLNLKALSLQNKGIK